MDQNLPLTSDSMGYLHHSPPHYNPQYPDSYAARTQLPPVNYQQGKRSSEAFHGAPELSATFYDGWLWRLLMIVGAGLVGLFLLSLVRSWIF